MSIKVDEADQRKQDAKAKIVDAQARLERAELQVSSIKRRSQLLETDLDQAKKRCSGVEYRLSMIELESIAIEEARRELEENENAGDEKIMKLEEQVKTVRATMEENSTKLVEAERKYTVVTRDIEVKTPMADALEKRAENLQKTIVKVTEFIKIQEAKQNLEILQKEIDYMKEKSETLELEISEMEGLGDEWTYSKEDTQAFSRVAAKEEAEDESRALFIFYPDIQIDTHSFVCKLALLPLPFHYNLPLAALFILSY